MKAIVKIKTVSEMNARVHWAARARRQKEQASSVFQALVLATGGDVEVLTDRVTITRHASKQMDEDNLASALKATRDAIAAWLHPEKIVTYWKRGKLIRNCGACDAGMKFILKQALAKRNESFIEIEIGVDKTKTRASL